MTITYSIQNLDEVAKKLINSSTHKTWLFEAQMGAGKTTLIKALAKNLGVTDMANSPTFSIVNEYFGDKGKVFHFDLYRLKNQEEAYDMGLDEYFTENVWCFVEWPEMAMDVIPDETHKVSIRIINEHTRELNFE
ncbi:tRNA (adenosine(37)-N6)-threonylcarbamoyltransferase complex ATPase subunit type 1 TsaE [Flavobacterium sp. CBA20B-1]|uniref:tRNA (adenosine(37)-N6)-threonylcarbamoyltransferase complex ATPase subunit type 1 TsaE n=1 Tax=unclassified Flavobacterium TaxID=196869 RepID=UPI0022246A50|nr:MULTISPECIES: tRNA (adenosine(37)-N6)-threonylcarbamoyltransferase complex ATPase subunit type 1 TsaE [unclassified Flavobacterium]WCM42368.1 tRNA (adenosine(37)-N6)-threonylcarbamoyltransferase complex ATPase subunit type 1 TsaE [Flavobacterium sp. CBA20B-1]